MYNKTSFEPGSKLDLYRKVIKQEFIREFHALVEAANGRQAFKADFTDKIFSLAKSIIGVVPLPTVPSVMITGLQWVANKSNDIRRNDLRNYFLSGEFTYDESALEILADAVALEAAKRYQWFVSQLEDSSVIRFAKTGVERMLEYVARNSLILNPENLLEGLVAGRSGAYEQGYFNTELTPEEHSCLTKRIQATRLKKRMTAEGAYGRSGWLICDSEKDEAPVLTVHALFDAKKARHRAEGRDKIHAYGFAKRYKKSAEAKYGYVLASREAVAKWYGHLATADQQQCAKQINDLKDPLRSSLNQFSFEIVPFNKTQLQAYIIAHQHNESLTLLDFLKSQHPQFAQARFAFYDCSDKDLTNLQLAGTHLDDAAFDECIFPADLTKTTLTRSHLRHADFRRVTHAEGLNLFAAKAEYLNAKEANLTGAILLSTNLTLANLCKAKLANTHLLAANLLETQLDEVEYNDPAELEDVKKRQQELLLAQQEQQKILKAQAIEQQIMRAELIKLQKEAEVAQANIVALKQQMAEANQHFDRQRIDQVTKELADENNPVTVQEAEAFFKQLATSAMPLVDFFAKFTMPLHLILKRKARELVKNKSPIDAYKQAYCCLPDKLRETFLKKLEEAMLYGVQNRSLLSTEMASYLAVINNIPNKIGVRPAYQKEQIQWEADLLKLICLNPEAAERANQPLLPISLLRVDLNKLKTIPESAYYKGHYYLHPEIAKQLLIDNGQAFKPKPAGQFGMHVVLPVSLPGERQETPDFVFKFEPEQPGVELAVTGLGRLVAGTHVTPPSELIRLTFKGKNIPILVSRYVKGENVATVFKQQIDNQLGQTKLDSKKLSELMLMMLLIRPEDGLPSNFMLSKTANGEYYFVQLDNDHAFVKEGVSKVNNGLQRRLQLQVKTFLYCLDQMHQPIDAEAVREFLNLDPTFLLGQWLSEQIILTTRLREMFSDADLRELQFSMPSRLGTLFGRQEKGCLLPMPFRAGMISKLRGTFKILQQELKKAYNDYQTARKPLPTLMQLLSLVDKEVAEIYQTTFTSYPMHSGKIALRLLEATKGEVIQDTQGHYLTTTQFGEIQHKMLGRRIDSVTAMVQILEQQQDSATQARNELDFHTHKEFYLRKIQEDLAQGQVGSFQTYFLLLKELPSIQTEILAAIDFSKIPQKDIHRQIIDAIKKSMKGVSCLILQNCVYLTASDLEAILNKNKDTLEVIDLSCDTAIQREAKFCLEDKNFMHFAQCSKLKKLNLSGRSELKKLATYREDFILFSQLTRFIMDNCSDLSVVKITAPRLAFISFKGCRKLTEVFVQEVPDSCRRELPTESVIWKSDKEKREIEKIKAGLLKRETISEPIGVRIKETHIIVNVLMTSNDHYTFCDIFARYRCDEYTAITAWASGNDFRVIPLAGGRLITCNEVVSRNHYFYIRDSKSKQDFNQTALNVFFINIYQFNNEKEPYNFEEEIRGLIRELYSPERPFILVGMHHAGRREFKDRNAIPITYKQCMEIAVKMGALAYFECSPYTGEGVNDTFNGIARLALNQSGLCEQLGIERDRSFDSHLLANDDEATVSYNPRLFPTVTSDGQPPEKRDILAAHL